MRPLTPFALALLAGSALAQTPASIELRTGCTAPAPQQSLVAKPLAIPTWGHNEPGLFAMEIEAEPAAWPWVAETELAGYTGESYYRWDGLGYDNSPPSYPALEYRFEVLEAGEYLFRLRNRHDNPDWHQ